MSIWPLTMPLDARERPYIDFNVFYKPEIAIEAARVMVRFNKKDKELNYRVEGFRGIYYMDTPTLLLN